MSLQDETRLNRAVIPAFPEQSQAGVFLIGFVVAVFGLLLISL